MTERGGGDGCREAVGGGGRIARATSAGAPNSGSNHLGSALALSRQPSAGGTSSPKRVSFALQPPPLDGRASVASPSRRRVRPLPQQGPALALITAADHSLVFIPEVRGQTGPAPALL